MDYNLNLTRVPLELKLLLELFNMDENNLHVQNINETKYHGVNWEKFAQLALHHRIYPLLNIKLKKLQETFIPIEVIQTLSQYYKKNTFKMLYLTKEMEEINNICHKNGIRLLNLKGPVLAEELYGDLSLRTCNDLDVLVPISHLDRMEKLLINLGYEKDDYIETILMDWKWRHHHITFIHPKKQIKIEVHWRLNPGPGKEPSFEELWNNKRQSTLTNSLIYLLGKEDLFMFLITHGARHGWSRLRWLVDIRQLIGQDLNWNELYPKLKKYHLLETGGQALILAFNIFSITLSEHMKPLCEFNKSKRLAQGTVFYLEEMVNLHSDSLPEHVSKYHKRHLFSLMSIQQKCIFVLSILYPYPDDAKILPLPKPLHFLYFPLRPFLWIWRKTGFPAFPRRT